MILLNRVFTPSYVYNTIPTFNYLVSYLVTFIVVFLIKKVIYHYGKNKKGVFTKKYKEKNFKAPIIHYS